MSATAPDKDPYNVLGVTPSTPFDDIRVVHRRLVRELHPDVNPGARARFDTVQEAFAAIRALHLRNAPGANAPSIRQDASGHFSTGAISPTPVDLDVPYPTIRPRITPVVERDSDSTADVYSPQSTLAGEPALDLVPDTTAVMEPDGTPSGRLETGPPTLERAPSSGVLFRRMPIKPDVPTEPLAPDPVLQPSGTPEGKPESTGPLTITATAGKSWVRTQSSAQMLYYLLNFTLATEMESATQQLNLMLVLDHSSSMGRGDKMTRLKEAVARIIDLMGPEDRLGIVAFADRATVLLPSAPLGDKRQARAALDGFRHHGGTEISTGLRLGVHELNNTAGRQVAGIILLTDGQTYGDEETCLELAVQAGERQVQITALGLGNDWNSPLLDAIAARSGGQACYVPTAETLTSVFESQVRTLQLSVLRNVSMMIRPTSICRVLRATWVAPLISYHPMPSHVAPGQAVELDLGRLSTNRSYRLLIEVVVTVPVSGTGTVADIICRYDAPTLHIANGSTLCSLDATFVAETEPEPPVHTRILDALRKITAHRLQEQAVQAIEEGQTLKATASLRTAAKHLEDAGHADLAVLVRAEASRAERCGTTQPANMKRTLYGTRGLG